MHCRWILHHLSPHQLAKKKKKREISFERLIWFFIISKKALLRYNLSTINYRLSVPLTLWPMVYPWTEKAMAPHSSTLVWRIPWMEDPGMLQSMGSLESDKTERLPFHFSLSCIGEGTGNPLQCSCLENPRDGEAWWAAIYGVAQSRTRLKWLSSNSSD